MSVPEDDGDSREADPAVSAEAEGRGDSRSTVEQEGEPDRFGFGIDGTMGDAQDVDHPFLGSVHGEHCRVCGLARSYRRHKEITP